mmetsp:Transcript_15793/g.50243  ORF Transcript_15793/g.50243 Transcript_15793/m.50243 type:complete len:264 (-) Transcript_15793:1630-2421(-)
MDAVLAVPVGPLIRMLKPRSSKVRIKNWLRHVSEVGTTIVWYGASLGTSKPWILSVHGFHFPPSSESMKRSWMRPFRGGCGSEPPPVMSTLVKSTTKLNFLRRSFLLSMHALAMSQTNRRPSASVHAPQVHSMENQKSWVIIISRSMKLCPMSSSSVGSFPSGNSVVGWQYFSLWSSIKDSRRRVAMMQSHPSDTAKGVLTRCVHSSMTSKYPLNKLLICSPWNFWMYSGKVKSQDATIGGQPKAVSGSKNTMPTRDTVAGEA